MFSPLTHLIDQQDLSRQKLSIVCNISHMTLYRIEHGVQQKITQKTLLRLCQHFNYDPKQFQQEYQQYLDYLHT